MGDEPTLESLQRDLELLRNKVHTLRVAQTRLEREANVLFDAMKRISQGRPQH